MNYNDYIGTRLADFKNKAYGSFQPQGIKGQCVWYARGRAYEKVNVDTGIGGDAKVWFEQAQRKGLKTGTDVRADSICCYNGGTYGHLRYIEAVDGDTVYYSEANVPTDNKISADDGIVRKATVSEIKAKAGYQGCIYLVADAETATENEAPTVKRGDVVVVLKSAKVYKNSTADKSSNTIKKNSTCKVTVIAENVKHPFHCISQDGGGVYGWVDAVVLKSNEGVIKQGDTVKIKAGAKDLNSNKKLSAFAYLRKYTVFELKNKRAVLKFKNTVVAAIDTDNLNKV